MIVALMILCILAAIGCLIFAAIIWYKRKKIDKIVEQENEILTQRHDELVAQNEQLRRSCSEKSQEAEEFIKIIKNKQIEQNELNELIEKLKDSRQQQIIVFEREQAKLEVINQQQDDAMMRLKATEEALETKQQSEQLLLRKAFEQYADNLDLEAANKEREYDELEKKLQSVYAEQQDLLAASKEDIIKEHEALARRLTEVYAAL